MVAGAYAVRRLVLDRWHLLEFWVKSRIRADGSVVAAVVILNATFGTQWSNPLWHVAGFAISSQADRVLDQLRKAVVKLPPLDDALAIDDPALLREFGQGLHWCAWLLSRIFTVASCLVGVLAACIYMRERLWALILVLWSLDLYDFVIRRLLYPFFTPEAVLFDDIVIQENQF